jgi:hypothetical protein
MLTTYTFQKAWLACVIPLLLPLCACNGGEETRCGEGNDKVPNIIDEGDLNTFWIASLGVAERYNLAGSEPEHNTLVQAHFSDFSYYRVIVAERMSYSEACYIYTSRQVVMGHCELTTICTLDEDCPEGYACLDDYCMPSGLACQEDRECPGDMLVCDPFLSACVSPECTDAGQCPVGYDCIEGKPIPLPIDQVTFAGLQGGDLVMTPDETSGRIPTEVLSGRAFTTDSVDIDVLSSGSEDDFPAFNESIKVPDFPELTGLGEHKDPDLASGPSIGIIDQREDPLMVRWKAGDGDYIEFKIIPGAGSETKHMKLRCVTFDDGCLEVPAEALINLSYDLATNFQVKIERHNFVIHTIEEGDVLKAAAMIDAASVYEGTVTR